MITRIARMQQQLTPDVPADPVERQEAILEEAARQIVEGFERQQANGASAQGLLLDLMA